ncbi:hypothetical protein FO519_008784 [Halicephalobus sp. NKZ332]|nr:hypothetical protein FO519_008784 [Halicephalobus sp. NKZ332]
MSVASYLVGSFSIRYQIRGDVRATSVSLPNRTFYQGSHSPKLLHLRFSDCFKLLPEKVDCIVVVNANLSSLSIMKMVVDEAKKYSEKVVVISATVARIMDVVRNADVVRINIGGYFLMVSLFQKISEFILLKRDRDKFKPLFREIGEIENVKRDMDRIYERENPEHISVVYEEGSHQDLVLSFQKFPNINFSPYQKISWVINRGGIEKALRCLGIYPTRDVANFSTGFDATLHRDPCPYEIVPFGTEFPFSMKPYYMPNRNLRQQIYFASEPIEKRNEVLLVSESIVGNKLFYPQEVDQFIVHFDKDGIPHQGDILGLIDTYSHISSPNDVESNLNSSVSIRTTPRSSRPSTPGASTSFISRRLREVNFFEDHRTSASSSISIDAPEDPLPRFTLTNIKKPTSVPEFETDGIRVFLGSHGFCGITVTKDGKTEMLKKDEHDDGWIPMYVSLKNGTPNVGISAFEDYQENPEAVIFDILKFLGKKYSEVLFDLKWKFQLVPQEEDRFLVKIKTSKGEKELDPELILAIILKSLKMLAENELGQHPMELKLDYELTEDVKRSLKNGCDRIGLFFDQ